MVEEMTIYPFLRLQLRSSTAVLVVKKALFCSCMCVLFAYKTTYITSYLLLYHLLTKILETSQFIKCLLFYSQMTNEQDDWTLFINVVTLTTQEAEIRLNEANNMLHHGQQAQELYHGYLFDVILRKDWKCR